MKLITHIWTLEEGWKTSYGESADKKKVQLVIYFGERTALSHGAFYIDLKGWYPNAHIVGCSSGAEIFGEEVIEGSIVATAFIFEDTEIKVSRVNIKGPEDSLQSGIELGKQLEAKDLKIIYILSDGLKVNGSDLTRGMSQVVGADVPLTGGLAGDNDRFKETLVGCDEPPKTNCIAAIGFYGNKLAVGHGSLGGWDPFGPERVVTKVKGNVLYELDHKPALALYKEYLGPDEAQGLPSSALLFPLTIRSDSSGRDPIVRTILSVNEEDQSMTFAGNIPEGSIAQLMHGNFDRLVEGAGKAAQQAQLPENIKGDQLAILVSCIGRKLLLKQYTGNEVEAVSHIFGKNMKLMGFYSYGEISPLHGSKVCELHNQTMTLTTLAET